MKLYKKVILLSTVVAGLTACRGDLMDLSSRTAIGSNTMWTTENLADKGVNAIYSTLFKEYVGIGLYKLDCFGVSSDCRDADYPLLTAKIETGNSLFSGYWMQHYAGVHRANDAIAHLPGVAMADGKKNRLVAEAKILRAYFYYKLNSVFKGVPVYLEPIELAECTKGRATEAEVWTVVLTDLTDAINTTDLPDRYQAKDANYGRVTKSLAYALRGKVYLYQKEWEKAALDFEQVGQMGHALFQGGYKQLFKEANEQSPEMIFSVQCIGLSGFGNDISFRYGSRNAFGSCWNSYLVNTDFVDSYQNLDGSSFNWDEVIPGYGAMTPKARAVYFFRDGLTAKEIESLASKGADMTKYLPTGNEERIRKAYENRDPRLTASVITPYSTYLGAVSSTSYSYTLRWPYRGSDAAEPFDLRTDTNNRFYYLFRKFVAEGAFEIPNRAYSPIDVPLIRYADVLLNLAEAYNEMGETAKAVECVNLVRLRAGVAALNANAHTQVAGQDDLRARIRNERRWEFNGEGVNFFDEMRWKTWHESKFFENAGLKEIWGELIYGYDWDGDFLYTWPVPLAERQKNPNLSLEPGWDD